MADKPQQEFRLSEVTKAQPSLKAAIRDGMGYSVMMGAGDAYLGPFAIALHGTVGQIGILASLPQFIGALSQAAGVWFMQHYSSRRTVLTYGVAINSAVWILIAFIPLFLGEGWTAVNCLITLAIIYHISNGFVAPLWSSLIGDLVPENIRGRYFASRNRLLAISTFIAVVFAGQVLELAQKREMIYTGFAFIFLIAFLARATSAYWLSRYEDPFFLVQPESKFSFWQFVRRAPRSNFAKFVFFGAFINFGVILSGPFFSVFMLRELKLSYFEFTLVTATATVTQFLTMQFWGRLSDALGNKRILTICGFGVSISPTLWLISTDTPALFLIQMYSGLVWAGYNLASGNFIFDAVSPPKLARCAAYQGIVNGAFVLLGAFSGGQILTALQGYGVSQGWHPYSAFFALFCISGAVRFVTSVIFLPRFHEVRKLRPVKKKEIFFEAINLRPIVGFSFRVFTGFRNKKVK